MDEDTPFLLCVTTEDSYFEHKDLKKPILIHKKGLTVFGTKEQMADYEYPYRVVLETTIGKFLKLANEEKTKRKENTS